MASQNAAFLHRVVLLLCNLAPIDLHNSLDSLLLLPNMGLLETRSYDLSLAASFNSRDRTAADWQALPQEADPGFVFKSLAEPKGAGVGYPRVCLPRLGFGPDERDSRRLNASDLSWGVASIDSVLAQVCYRHTR